MSEGKKEKERPIGGSGKYLFIGKSDTGFVGLFNQGATCYLNSLLQALYMTPQFKKSLFEFRAFDRDKDGDPEYHIPYQLQLLFARLDTSKQPAVNTKGLTKSFHWDRAQSFEQADVQELMKVLFEALEKTLHLDPKSSFTSNLYMGQSKDYLKSLAGDGFVRELDSKFDSLSLALSEKIDSVEKGIAAFLKPETLTGGNRWRHPKTGEKVDAEKGIHLTELPSVLTITLNRFKMDYQLMARVKINQKVSVPETIDMNQFVPDEKKKTGSWSYDLFAILMHSGTARGGHYYAYIKSWKDQKWYCFNDAVVRPLEAKEGEDVLALAHGNGKAGTSAYLLMYMDRAKKAETTTAEIPEHILKIIQKEDAEWEAERAEYERQRRLICMTIYYNNTEINYDCDRGEKGEAVLTEVLKKANVSVKAGCARLRRYEPAMGWAQNEVESEKTLEDQKFHRNTSLILETREEDDDWPKINPNAIPVRIVKADEGEIPKILESLHYDGKGLTVATMMLEKTMAFGEAKEQISKLISIDAGALRLMKLDTQHSEVVNSSAATQEAKGTKPTLLTLNITPGVILYAEKIVPEQESKLITEYDKTVGQISVEFNMLSGKEGKSNPIVTVSKNKTIKQLKEKMLPILGLEHIDEFRLKRSAKAAQFKDEDATLEKLEFMSHQYVYVERGRPLRKGECNLKFYYFDAEEDAKKQIKFLFQIPVLESIKITELNKDLLRFLNDVAPDGKGGNKYGVKHIRLRDYQSRGPGAIYQSNLKLNRGLKTFKRFRDGDGIVIQKILKPEVVDKNKNHLIFVHQFQRDTDRMHPRKELVVGRMTTVGELMSKLEELSKQQNETPVTREHMGLGKGKLTSKTTVNDCIAMKWTEAKGLDAKDRIATAFKIRAEGTLIFCDLTTTVRSKPPERKSTPRGKSGSRSPRRFRRASGGVKKGTGEVVVRSTTRNARPERALKIWTQAEKAEMEKRKEEAKKNKEKEEGGKQENKKEEDIALKKKLEKLAAEGEASGGKRGGVRMDL